MDKLTELLVLANEHLSILERIAKKRCGAGRINDDEIAYIEEMCKKMPENIGVQFFKVEKD